MTPTKGGTTLVFLGAYGAGLTARLFVRRTIPDDAGRVQPYLTSPVYAVIEKRGVTSATELHGL